MNNTTEFSDNSKPIDPKILSQINSTERHGQKASSTPKNNLSSNEIPQDNSPTPDLSTVDFTSRKGLPTNAKSYVSVQDLSDDLLNGLRIPVADGRFRRMVIPRTRNNVPVIPKRTYIPDTTTQGYGDIYFADWMSQKEDSQFNDLIMSNEKFAVKMDAETSTKLMADVTVWSNAWLNQGLRDTRARPDAILGDWGCFLTPTYSTNHRYIRTDLLAAWMYGAFTQDDDNPEYITIINATDLRDFLNDSGSYWPVPQTTPCLALGKAATATLGQLSLLGVDLIIDFDSSMNASRGAVGTYNGVRSWSVKKTTASYNNLFVGRVLSNTFSAVDIEWALLANTLPLAADVENGCVFGGNAFNLTVYENSITDQFINFYLTHHDFGNKLPQALSVMHDFIQAWRFFKTMLTQRTTIEYGFYGMSNCTQTFGKSMTVENYLDLISCCFDPASNNSVSPFSWKCSLMWIPFEMWVSNGANITLDGTEYVDGESGVLTNLICKIPRSQYIGTYEDWESEAATTSSKTLCRFYIPNSATSSLDHTVPTGTVTVTVQCVFPATIPRYTSTTDTATQMWNKQLTIDFVYTKKGLNSNAIHRRKLVFN